MDYGADPTLRDGPYESPLLTVASRLGDAHIVKALVQMGAKVDIIDQFFSTPLQAAAAVGAKRVVKTLLELGASLDIKTGLFGSALLAATAGFHTQTVKQLQSLLPTPAPNINVLWKDAFERLKAASILEAEHLKRCTIQCAIYWGKEGYSSKQRIIPETSRAPFQEHRLVKLWKSNDSIRYDSYDSALIANYSTVNQDLSMLACMDWESQHTPCWPMRIPLMNLIKWYAQLQISSDHDGRHLHHSLFCAMLFVLAAKVSSQVVGGSETDKDWATPC